MVVVSNQRATTTIPATANEEIPIPPVGLGTYRTGGYNCFETVKTALELGYRHVDTAMAYENEAVVGRAIEASPVDRDEVFLTTKIKGYPRFLTHEQVIESAHGCLDRLGVDRIDLLLIHWWNSDAKMAETFAAMGELVDEGVVSHVGVSNFSLEQLQHARRVSPVPLLTNQVEYHPYWEQRELLDYCQEEDIILTAYSPLAEGRVVDDPVLGEIGEKYQKSAAQVAIRWLIEQESVVTIPKSTNPDRLEENLDVFDFALTEHDRQRIQERKGPWWYRHNRKGGVIFKFRSIVGPMADFALPARVLNR